MSIPEIQHPHKWIDADVYLFDIDGTLLNASGRAHYNAFNRALREIFGVNTTIDGVPWHGNTDIGILRAVLRREGVLENGLEEKLAAVVSLMGAEVERNRSMVRSEVCPSIPLLVRLLHAQGKLLGVASGNFESIGWVKVEVAGLREYFSFGSFSDRAELRSEIFRHATAEARHRRGEAARICVIGDTPSDIEAARANGISVVAVATGIYPPAQLAEHRPDVLLGCCDELFAPASF